MDKIKKVLSLKPNRLKSQHPVRKHFAIRDPIHEWITCSSAEKEIVNSPLMQRLKWIMQLSLVNQVFNGGTHSRFSHSLGAMKVAGEYMKHLFDHGNLEHLVKKIIDEESVPNVQNPDNSHMHFITLARMAGLLHDIGHGPFSHSFDHVVYKKIYSIDDGGHDYARLNLVRSDLLAPLLTQMGIRPEQLIEIWEPFATDEIVMPARRAMYNIIRAVVGGPFGADRIDFMRRDSYYTGTQHLGTIGYRRIIDNCIIVFPDDESAPHLSYNEKCMGDMIRALDGRTDLYREVYFHKTSMAATLLIEEILDLVCEPLDLQKTVCDPEAFSLLNDTTLLAEVMHKPVGTMLQNSSKISQATPFEIDMESARRLCTRLMLRQLPKMLHEEIVTDLKTPYNAEIYATRWFRGINPNKYRIIRTRIVSGISPQKFKKYKISFHNSGGEILDCKDVLRERDYTPQKPYYIVRGYIFPVQ